MQNVFPLDLEMLNQQILVANLLAMSFVTQLLVGVMADFCRCQGVVPSSPSST